MSNPATVDEKYSEKVKVLGRALKVADCDVFLMEIHTRLVKLEEEKKIERGTKKRDELIELRKKLNESKLDAEAATSELRVGHHF